jgi:hypothetical protein
MSIFDKLFGRSKDATPPPAASVPVPQIDPKNRDGVGLQLLFPGPLNLNTASLQSILRSYGGPASTATFAIDADAAKQGTPFGRAQWGRHVVDIIGFNAPMPSDVVEKVVGGAHYPQPLKAQARQHKSHILLFYSGTETSVLERYVALAAVAGALATQGALVVANESAMTSFPAQALDPRQIKGDRFAYLRDLPLLILYMGFMKYNLENGPVWMRTYGGDKFALPDLAKATAGHHEGEKTMEMFMNILGYLMDSRATIAAGHTLQIATDVYLRFRAPSEDEYFLHDHPNVLVAEEIAATGVNRPA